MFSLIPQTAYTSMPVENTNAVRRAFFVWMLAELGSSAAVAQPVSADPVPAAWQALGIVQWPPASPLLALEFDEIVIPGPVRVKLRSSIPFTQSLTLFRRIPGSQSQMEQLATAELGPRRAFVLNAQADVTQRQYFVALAKTPNGWFQQMREIKVGRASQ